MLTFTRTKKGRYEWIQLVGHPGTFKEGLHDGYVLKELCGHERRCCELLQSDILKEFVPKYNGTIKDEEGKCKNSRLISFEIFIFVVLSQSLHRNGRSISIIS